MAKRNTLPPKQVKIPGILVWTSVVVVPEQRQTYATDYDSKLRRRTARADVRNQAVAVRAAQGDRASCRARALSEAQSCNP